MLSLFVTPLCLATRSTQSLPGRFGRFYVLKFVVALLPPESYHTLCTPAFFQGGVRC